MRRSLLRKVCYDQTQTFTYCEKKGHTKANCWKKNPNKVPKYINTALTIAISMQRRMLQQFQIQHQCQLTKRFMTCVIEKNQSFEICEAALYTKPCTSILTMRIDKDISDGKCDNNTKSVICDFNNINGESALSFYCWTDTH